MGEARGRGGTYKAGQSTLGHNAAGRAVHRRGAALEHLAARAVVPRETVCLRVPLSVVHVGRR